MISQTLRLTLPPSTDPAIEPARDSDVPVGGMAVLTDRMPLARVVDELGRHVQRRERGVELPTLRIRNAAVLLADQDQRRRLGARDVGGGRGSRPMLRCLPGEALELERPVLVE